MVNQRRNNGYSLFELIIVLSFVGAILTFTVKFTANQQQNSRVQLLVSDLSDLKDAVYSAGKYLDHEVMPEQLVSEQLYFGDLDSPWGEPYQIEYTEYGTYVTGFAKSNQFAARVAKQLPAAEVENGWVKLFIHRPNLQLDVSQFLHRELITDRPYLNQMNTDLDMQGNNIFDAQELTANQSEFTNVSANTAWLSNLVSEDTVAGSLSATNVTSDTAAFTNAQADFLAVSELSVSDLFAENLSVSAPLISVQNLQINNLQGSSLTAEELSVAHQLSVSNAIQANNAHFYTFETQNLDVQNATLQTLSADELSSDSVVANSINVNSFSANQLDISGNLQVSQLNANTIIANDFVTATSSLVAVQKLAAKLDSLWLQCTVDGGCQ